MDQDRGRQDRMAQVREAYADVPPDEDYADLSHAWDKSAADGLTDA